MNQISFDWSIYFSKTNSFFRLNNSTSNLHFRSRGCNSPEKSKNLKYRTQEGGGEKPPPPEKKNWKGRRSRGWWRCETEGKSFWKGERTRLRRRRTVSSVEGEEGEGGGIWKWWRARWEREEAGGHRASLSRMRSDLSRSLSFLEGDGPDLLRARCWYSKTLSGDERHYPHQSGW